MMRIGLDHRLTAYRTGGISTYVTELARVLPALDPENDYTLFFHRRQANPQAQPPACAAVLWTPCHHRLERLALSAELARFRLDLLHSPDFIPPLRGAKRHVITVHDLTFLHYPQHLTAESRRYYNDQIATAVAHADHILTDSESSRRDMITMLGVAAERITVHMLGVDPLFRPPDAAVLAHWRDALGLPAQYWLFVGTFEPRKNIRGLLESYARIRSLRPNAPALVLAGTRGWLQDDGTARIGALGLEAHVHRIEGAPREALPALYAGALAIVTPSFYEGFGLPALEGMACGTVPIVSNRSSLPEVVGEVGLQITPEDTDALAQAMLRPLDDPDWHAAQVRAGRTRAAQFTWENTARIVRDVYKAVLA